jgi:hypothetical protein
VRDYQSEIIDHFDRLAAGGLRSALVTAVTLVAFAVAWRSEAGVGCGGRLILGAPR